MSSLSIRDLTEADKTFMLEQLDGTGKYAGDVPAALSILEVLTGKYWVKYRRNNNFEYYDEINIHEWGTYNILTEFEGNLMSDGIEKVSEFLDRLKEHYLIGHKTKTAIETNYSQWLKL
uniref:Uncharacterized protein n=1 Tax=Pithovirus LCPAC103 TaxID=2506588 RepID=A0A481Z5X1_9VIRU|nr:MAG: hypothetical protein LCPAC103_01610 [Pithovirus LCPAC103]